VIQFVHSRSKVQFGDEFFEGTGGTNKTFNPKDSNVKISRKSPFVLELAESYGFVNAKSDH
jgi:hypothetical protein